MILRSAFLLFPALLCAQPHVDLLLRGGQVIDGSGAPGRSADLGIRGDRIVFMGNGATVQAERILDVKGLVVSPGFIDPHAHVLADLSNTPTKANEPYLMQGVTTTVTGNDGQDYFVHQRDVLSGGRNVLREGESVVFELAKKGSKVRAIYVRRVTE